MAQPRLLHLTELPEGLRARVEEDALRAGEPAASIISQILDVASSEAPGDPRDAVARYYGFESAAADGDAAKPPRKGGGLARPELQPAANEEWRAPSSAPGREEGE